MTEAVQGVLIGGFLTPLGLVQAMTVYSRGHGFRLGLSIMKMRFLRALHGAGLPFHELGPAQPSYPKNGPMSGYFYRHPDPVIPVCWLAEEIAPAVEQAVSMHQIGYSVPGRQPGPDRQPEAQQGAPRAGERLRHADEQRG